jgi:hypothetical protein
MSNSDDPPRNRPWERDNRDDDDRPRRRRDDDDFDDRPRRRGREKPSNGLATAGLILGLLSFCAGWLAGIPGLICSGMALSKPTGRGMAIAGLVLSVLGSVAQIGLLLFAVSRVREAASRQSDMNNLKQLSLGMHNYHDVNQRLPQADGQLSWRFHLLPYIEQNRMYQAMNPDEPWDGPTNKQFANTAVRQFVSRSDPEGTVETRYRVFTGPNTLFPPDRKPLKLTEITDGTSNTIMMVEAREMVPWPQPKELPYNRDVPLPALGFAHRNGFIVATADGAVRFVSDKVSPDVIRAGIDPNDGKFFNP